MREKVFTVSSKLALNDYAVSIDFLADSEANEFIFIDTHLIIDTTKFLRTKLIRLSETTSTREYNEDLAKDITHVILLNL